MTNNEKDKYISLLEEFKDIFIKYYQKHGNGWTMEQLEIIKKLQDFEDSLECNQS